MMPRHLLTLFALFTGLAAIHAPANASALESGAVDARAIAGAADHAAAEIGICQEYVQRRGWRCPQRAVTVPFQQAPGSLRPVFVFGSERALE